MTDHCCQREVDIQPLQDAQRRVLRTVFVVNAATCLLMLAAAFYSHSSSLLSGGLDNFGDAVTYALSLAVVGASQNSKRRVALFKGLLIFAAALAVAAQILWRLLHPTVPLFDAMGAAALLNLAANSACAYLLMPHRHGDINMASAWECSRNDVFEGFAVILAAVTTGLFHTGWPDLIIASALLVVFLRSAWRVLRAAWQSAPSATHTDSCC